MEYWTPARVQLAQSCRFSKPLLPYCTALLSSKNPEDPSCNYSLNNYCSPGCVCEKHSLPQGSSIKTRGWGKRPVSQKEPERSYKSWEGLQQQHLSGDCYSFPWQCPAGDCIGLWRLSWWSAGKAMNKDRLSNSRDCPEKQHLQKIQELSSCVESSIGTLSYADKVCPISQSEIAGCICKYQRSTELSLTTARSREACQLQPGAVNNLT